MVAPSSWRRRLITSTSGWAIRALSCGIASRRSSSSASSTSTQSPLTRSRAALRAGAKSPGHSMRSTRAPQASASPMVPSTEPVSTSTISSANPCTDRRQASIRASSSRTIIERLSMLVMSTAAEARAVPPLRFRAACPVQSVKSMRACSSLFMPSIRSSSCF